MKKIIITLFVLVLSFQSASLARLGLRGGLGTDISGGLALGASGNYQLDHEAFTSEFGIHLFLASNSSTSSNTFHTYNESTSMVVFGELTNLLLNYKPNSPFFIAGAGFALVNVAWKETSPTDTSLGTLLPGGGSEQSVNSLAAGSVLNLGFGYLFENGLDLRFETPMIVLFSVPGRAAAFVPTFTITGGARF